MNCAGRPLVRDEAVREVSSKMGVVKGIIGDKYGNNIG